MHFQGGGAIFFSFLSVGSATAKVEFTKKKMTHFKLK